MFPSKLKIMSFILMSFSCSVFSNEVDSITFKDSKASNYEVSEKDHISEEEKLRYVELMNNFRGYISPKLDPITTLGIEARNEAERRHYAELWIKQEFERTEKELKFQREVDAAWKRLMPNMLPVNMGNAAGIAHDSGGRLALFVREADCQRCDARLSAVLADKRPVDIYLVYSEGSDQKLRSWAQQHRIPAEQVRERRITLNHDAGRWMRYERHHDGSSTAGGKRMAYRSVLTVALLLSAASSVASTSMQSVPSGYQKVALQHGVPAESLYSLALAESSRKLPHGTRPWPWTINVAQINAFKTTSGYIDISVLYLVSVGLLVCVLFLWAAWAAVDFWHGRAYNKVRGDATKRSIRRRICIYLDAIPNWQ